MSSLSQLVAHGISLLEGGNEANNITEVLTEYLQQQKYTPPIDIIDNAREIILYVTMVGIDADSIDVDFFNNAVNIKGERLKPYQEAECIIHKNEIIYGLFIRTVNLPISVTSRESVDIKFDNGVLIIRIDKIREARNRFSIRGVQTTSSLENADIILNYTPTPTPTQTTTTTPTTTPTTTTTQNRRSSTGRQSRSERSSTSDNT